MGELKTADKSLAVTAEALRKSIRPAGGGGAALYDEGAVSYIVTRDLNDDVAEWVYRHLRSAALHTRRDRSDPTRPCPPT